MRKTWDETCIAFSQTKIQKKGDIILIDMDHGGRTGLFMFMFGIWGGGDPKAVVLIVPGLAVISITWQLGGPAYFQIVLQSYGIRNCHGAQRSVF